MFRPTHSDHPEHDHFPDADYMLSESLQNRCRKSRQNKCKHKQARSIRQGIDAYFDSQNDDECHDPDANPAANDEH